jgi:hypothetical protein
LRLSRDVALGLKIGRHSSHIAFLLGDGKKLLNTWGAEGVDRLLFGSCPAGVLAHPFRKERGSMGHPNSS